MKRSDKGLIREFGRLDHHDGSSLAVELRTLRGGPPKVKIARRDKSGLIVKLGHLSCPEAIYVATVLSNVEPLLHQYDQRQGRIPSVK